MTAHTKRRRRSAFRAHHETLGTTAMAAHLHRGFMAWIDAIGPSVRRHLAVQEDAPCERAGDGWSGTIGGACPLQGDGNVDGLPWYFRARGGSWSFSVAATPDGDPVAAGFRDAPPGSWYVDGDAEGDGAYAGSWMPYSEGWQHIEASIAEWRAWRASGATDGAP